MPKGHVAGYRKTQIPNFCLEGRISDDCLPPTLPQLVQLASNPPWPLLGLSSFLFTPREGVSSESLGAVRPGGAAREVRWFACGDIAIGGGEAEGHTCLTVCVPEFHILPHLILRLAS